MKTSRIAVIWFSLILLGVSAAVAPCLAGSAVLAAAAAAPQPAAPPSSAPAPAQTPAPAAVPVPTMIDLSGTWKFSTDRNEVGQEQGWYKPDFDSSTWRTLTVPGPWEDQGITFPNPAWPSTEENDAYNGYAWYRRSVTIPAGWTQEQVTLHIGAIDDSDWTYVNGKLVGSTPEEDRYDAPREYTIPADLLRPGKPNVIAIEVLDRGGAGGITDGPVELLYGAPVAAEAPEPGPESESEPMPQYQPPTTLHVPQFGPWDVTVQKVRSLRDWTYALIVLAFFVALAAVLFPRRLQVMARVLPMEPTGAALAGLLGAILSPAAVIALTLALAFVILVLTIIVLIGWVVMPAAVVAYALALAALPGIAALGFIAVCLAVGDAVLARTGHPNVHPVWSALLGLLLLWFVLFLSDALGVVALGVLLWITVGIFGLGLALVTGVGTSERWRPPALRRRQTAEPEEAAAAPESTPAEEPAGLPEAPAEGDAPVPPDPEDGDQAAPADEPNPTA